MKIYKINKEFIVQKMGNKMVIFDGKASVLYNFNETATYILNKLKSGIQTNEIIELLIKRYNISLARAKKDYQDLITDLLKKKIITQKTE